MNNLCDDNSFAGLHVDDANDSSEHELSSDTIMTNNSNTATTVQGCLKQITGAENCPVTIKKRFCQ